MNDKELNERLRKESGSVDIKSKLVDFLYTLMRDHIPIGTVESLVREAEICFDKNEEPNCYSNGYLARYAENLAIRLTDDTNI